jgi:glycine cleavage system H protein
MPPKPGRAIRCWTRRISLERYSADHAWARAEGALVRVGLSAFALAELGDVAWVELPTVGRRVQRGEPACSIESLKSTGEVYAPVSGTVAGVNTALSDEQGCRTVNRDPLGDGWLFTLRPDDPAELDALMTAEAYERWVSAGTALHAAGGQGRAV